jgi:glycosyltransferase involved in cell wall biosynthesis
MMRWGETLCDGVAEPAKCAACALQQRGLPKLPARALGAMPPALGRLAARLPGRLGSALGMSDLIAWNVVRQRALLATADRFVLLTRWAYDAARANGAPLDKLELMRLGVAWPTSALTPGAERVPTAAPVTVGYLGRLDPLKGVEDLVRATLSLPADTPIRVEIHGAADGPRARAWVERLVATARGDARIRFGPAVAHDEVPALLARWDLLCCPSLILEGGPTVALEARAVGTPVLGARIGGLAELVRDHVDGRLVAPGDWRALAAVLAGVTADPAGTVDRWRRALPPVRSMQDVAADCLAVYAGGALRRPEPTAAS